MTTFKKLISLLLAALFCVSFAACATPSGETDGTTAAPAGDSQTASVVTEDPDAPKYDENGYRLSDLPELNFNDEVFTGLYWKDVEMPEYESEGPNGQLVNDAIYTRNSNVEGKLHVTLAWEKTAGNGSNINNYVSVVENAFKSGGADYDMLSSYSRTTSKCALDGYVADMTDLPYLNFEMPWWPESLLDIVPIGGRIYFASGDASINVLHFMYGIYYNKDLIINYNLEDPVKLVDDDKWTIAKLQELCTGIYQDVNQNNQKDVDDIYGFTTVNYGLDAFYTGSGLRLVENEGGDTLLTISEDFYSDKAVDLSKTLGGWFKTQDAWVNGSHETPFVNGRAIFDQNRCYLADRKLQDVTFKYGILPTPKYDENQEDFISVDGNPFSLYAIYGLSENKERAAAVLECWASEAYRTTTPAQFELNMKAKYSESSDESRMYDIIRSTICFDLGRLFNKQLSDITDIFFGCAETDGNWKLTSKSFRKVLTQEITSVSASFADQQAS